MSNQQQFLIAADSYLKAGIHIGTKFKTKHMSKFIYKTREDGLSVLNLQQIDERIKTLISFLSQYKPEDIIIACRRENGWKPIKVLSKYLDVKKFIGRYPPGSLTNPLLETYTEGKVLLVCDPWPDRNIINDALNVGITVIALCDTNNQSNLIDLVIPCNNKGKKALALIFYLLTTELLKLKDIKELPKKEDFEE